MPADAFLSRLELYRDRMIQYAAKLVGHNDAEDCVQDALLKAWKCQEAFEYRSEEQLRDWLFNNVLHNICLDHFRRNRNAPLPIDPYEASEKAVGIDPAEVVLDVMELNENTVTLRRLVNTGHLTHRQEEILNARLDHETTQATANRLGITPDCVRAHASLAVKRLRELLADGTIKP